MSQPRRVPVDPKTQKAVELPAFGDEPARPAKPDPESCNCPRLEREEWHEVENDWSDIAFLRGSTTAAMGVPLGYGDSVRELRGKAASLGLSVPEDAMVLLGEGRFRRPVLLEVEGSVTGRDVERPGGSAFTYLAPAPFGAIKDVVKAAEAAAKEQTGREPDATWLWYLTCRVCSAAREFETLVVCQYRPR